MSEALVCFYRYFHTRKARLFSGVVIIFLALIWMASGIKFEENISGMVSNDKASRTLEMLGTTDKIIITISPGDTTDSPNPDSLEIIGQMVADTLATRCGPGLIKSIAFRASDTIITGIMDLVVHNIPLFLREEDYQKIDSMLSPAFIREAMKKNYKLLMSPAGMVVKQRIASDPLGISELALSGLRSLQPDDHFEVRNGCIYTGDMKNMLIFVVPANAASETALNDQLIDQLDASILAVKESVKSHHNIRYFGGTAVAVANARQIKKDVLLTVSISLILILGFTGWYFRNFWLRFIGLLPAVFGAAMALALLAVFRGKISAISLGIGSVLLGMIVDYALYLINQYKNNGDLPKAIRELTPSILICSITSMGAFLCLTFLNSTVLRDLGWFAALSIMGAVLFTLLVLPNLLGKNIVNLREKRPFTFVDKLASYPFHQKTWLISALSAALFASLFFSGKVQFEEDMYSLSFMPPELGEAEKHLSFISEKGVKNMYLVATGNDPESALRVKERTYALLTKLLEDSVIQRVNHSGPLLLSDSAQRSRIARWRSFWDQAKSGQLRENIYKYGREAGFRPDAFQSFLLLPEQEFSPIPPAEMLKKGAPLLNDWLINHDSVSLAPVLLQVPEKNLVKVNLAIPQDENLILFDRYSMTQNFILLVKHDFELLVNLSMIFVTLLLIISLGRIGLGLITAMPMFAAWLLTLGIMGITGTRFNIFNIIISSFVFGLGVDYSILIMRGLQRQLITGTDELAGYKSTVILSAMTTIFGVGALMAARHPALHSIGLTSVVGIVLVMLMAMTIIPLLFNTFILERARRHLYPITPHILIRTLLTWGNIVAIAIFLMVAGIGIRYLFPCSLKCKRRIFLKLFTSLSRFYIWSTFGKNYTVIHESSEDFSKPAIIISNHQSLIETPAFIRLKSNILIFTSGWVFRSPIFGPVARLAGFLNAEKGIESMEAQLKEKMAEGYSILIFPEAHRSKDHEIQRFHRGAFYLAEKLRVDLLPVMVFGSGDFLGKGAFFGRPNAMSMLIMKRIAWNDLSFGNTYQEKARKIRQFYVEKYSAFRTERGNAHYYRRLLMLNYILKGPVLEWYTRIKLKLENDYDFICRNMPSEGSIVDIGCGYGYIAYMLMFTGDRRIIKGIDHDHEKIILASNCFSANDRISFEVADVADYALAPSHGFLISDVLHYLSPDQQRSLLDRCFKNLLPGGIIIIREANAGLEKQHRRSRLTEFFSTRSGFNQTSSADKQLHFITEEELSTIAGKAGFSMSMAERKRITSNMIFILRRDHDPIPGFEFKPIREP